MNEETWRHVAHKAKDLTDRAISKLEATVSELDIANARIAILEAKLSPKEMVRRLTQLAQGNCTHPFGPSGYTCREYDAAAMYDDEGAACERCQAADALADLLRPDRNRAQRAEGTLEAIRRLAQ